MSNKDTAKNAIKILCESKKGFKELRPDEKNNLSTIFAREYNIPLYGNAFDLIYCNNSVDFSQLEEIRKSLDSILIYEIKSTNKESLSEDFNGYFFDLTTAELLVAQSLGDQFRFIFVNTVNRHYRETTLQGLLSCARKIYPKWAITLGPLSIAEK